MLAIYFTQVTPRCCSRTSGGKSGVLDERFIRGRVDGHRLLDQTIEELAAAARAAAIEPKGELVEVVVEMFERDPAMVRAEQPALEGRRDARHMRHELRRRRR